MGMQYYTVIHGGLFADIISLMLVVDGISELTT